MPKTRGLNGQGALLANGSVGHAKNLNYRLNDVFLSLLVAVWTYPLNQRKLNASVRRGFILGIV